MIIKSKSVSMKIQLGIRFIATCVFFLGIYLFYSKISKIGRLADIGLANGVYLLICEILQFLGLFFSSEGMNKQSDPLNSIFYKRYIAIWGSQFILFVIHGLFVMNEKFELEYKILFLAVFFFVVIMALFIHGTVLKQYRKLEDDEFEVYVKEYMDSSIDREYDMGTILSLIAKFLVYMIVVCVFMKYILWNWGTIVIFLVATFFYYIKQWGNIISKKRILLQIFLITIGIILINQLPFFQMRTYDEKGMVLWLFYFPTLLVLIKILNENKRKYFKWVR